MTASFKSASELKSGDRFRRPSLWDRTRGTNHHGIFEVLAILRESHSIVEMTVRHEDSGAEFPTSFFLVNQVEPLPPREH